MTDHTCETCPAWDDNGHCHRHAPQPLQFGLFGADKTMDDAEDTAIWPLTDASDWCAEHPDHPIQRPPRPFMYGGPQHEKHYMTHPAEEAGQ